MNGRRKIVKGRKRIDRQGRSRADSANLNGKNNARIVQL